MPIEKNIHLPGEIATLASSSVAEVLESYRFMGWTILLVQPNNLEKAYLFYAPGFKESKYVTLWAGHALDGEGPSIRAWVTENAPGIPERMVVCFASIVSSD